MTRIGTSWIEFGWEKQLYGKNNCMGKTIVWEKQLWEVSRRLQSVTELLELGGVGTQCEHCYNKLEGYTALSLRTRRLL